MAESTDTTIGEPVPERLQRGFSFRSALSLAFADVSPIACDVGWRERKVHLSAQRYPLLVSADTDGREVGVSHRSART